MPRLGVIADTHLASPDATLERIVRQYFSDVDMILHLGDYVNYAVAAYLIGNKKLIGVAGNMDPPEIRNAFPFKHVLELGNFRIGLIHGWGAPFGLERKIWKEFGDVHAVVYGHTHKAVNHRKHGVLFFNPGSARASFFGEPTVGILLVENTIQGEIIHL